MFIVLKFKNKSLYKTLNNYCNNNTTKIEDCERDYDFDTLYKYLIDDNLSTGKVIAARYGYGINTLIYNRNLFVRREIIRQGYRLDVYFKDIERESLEINYKRLLNKYDTFLNRSMYGGYGITGVV